MSHSREFLDYFTLWQDELDASGNNHSPEWQSYRSPHNAELVKAEAEKFTHGHPAIGAFIIAFDKLRSSGAIQPVRASENN